MYLPPSLKSLRSGPFQEAKKVGLLTPTPVLAFHTYRTRVVPNIYQAFLCRSDPHPTMLYTRLIHPSSSHTKPEHWASLAVYLLQDCPLGPGPCVHPLNSSDTHSSECQLSQSWPHFPVLQAWHVVSPQSWVK